MRQIKEKQNIPQGWKWVALGDLVLIKKGEQLNRIMLDDSGEYPCLNGGIYPSGYTDKWNTEAYTITISEGGNSCGYVNFNTERFWCGGHCYALIKLGENIDNNFLYQALKSKQDHLMKLRVGSGLPNIQKRSIEEFLLLLPESIKEQKKIAEILGAVDEEIETVNSLIMKIEKLKKGLMQKLFTRGIGHTKFKKTKLGEIPEEWEVVTFGEVSLINPKLAEKIKDSERVGFISMADVSNSAHVINIQEREYREVKKGLTYFKANDILFAKITPCMENGKGGLCPNKYKNNFGSTEFHVLRATEKIAPQYIYQYLNNPQFRKVAEHNMRGSAGQKRVPKEFIENYQFPLPAIDEQQEIAEILSAVDEKILVNKKLKEKLAILKKGLMQDLLSGKVQSLCAGSAQIGIYRLKAVGTPDS